MQLDHSCLILLQAPVQTISQGMREAETDNSRLDPHPAIFFYFLPDLGMR